jgi:hypothetical protein
LSSTTSQHFQFHNHHNDNYTQIRLHRRSIQEKQNKWWSSWKAKMKKCF